QSDAWCRITYSGGELIDQSLKRTAAARSEEAASIGIGVYIQHRLSPQFVGVGFNPFCGAEQAGFFAIPARVNQRALRSPSLPDESADGLGFGHQRHVGRQRVPRTKHPTVMVIAANHPLV